MDLSALLSLIIMVMGLIIFFLGVFTWLYGKFKGIRIIDFWIYQYSRHPQYFGFLLWSYGLTILASTIGAHKGGYVPPPSLPWLISTLIIVGVALHEENVMVRMYGDEYVRYRNCTPFMLPLPKQISNLATLPMRKLLGKSRPENGREIAFIILLYSIILILLSTPLIPFLKI
jgi:protein-S-isoprenylcysteine O-methyltransferase Ste14